MDYLNLILSIALSYVRSGLSLTPIKADGSKAPAAHLLPHNETAGQSSAGKSWKVYQQRLPTIDELRHWYLSSHYPPGIGIVCGRVSGGLEVIDFDNDAVADQWIGIIESQYSGLHARFPIVRTPRPGYHVYYRREGCRADGSHKLAQAPDPCDPSCPKTLIELKGEGGYVLAPGSPPACHETFRTYEIFGSPALTQVPVINDQIRDVLLSAASSLNKWTLEPRRVPRPAIIRQRLLQATPLRPGDAFDDQADWAKILEPAGWTFVGSTRDGEERWRRPGKHHGVSATINYADLDRLYVFSSSAHPFQAGRMYTKFQAFALLRHGGDYRSAAGELRKNGFGGRPGFSTPIQSLADRVRLASGSSYRARRM